MTQIRMSWFPRKRRADFLARLAFFLSCGIAVIGGAFIYGVVAHWKDLPPVPLMKHGYYQLKELVQPSDWFLVAEDLRYETPVATLLPDRVAPGLVLVAGDYEPRHTSVRIMDRTGRMIHEWRVPWSDVWPGQEGAFPEHRRPAKSTYLHGIDMLPDGSFVANFEHLSTFRMDICGNVLWKLDNLGHHSVHYDGDGALWVSAEDYIEKDPTGFDNHLAPLNSWTLQEIDVDGTILRTIPVIEVLQRNGLEGLLYLSTLRNDYLRVGGDTLHLNDVESFPNDMEPGVFAPGDLAISLRNINTVMVINSETLAVKMISSGHVLRQHDVDFISGDRVSVFDNRNPLPADRSGGSRIVEVDGRTGKVETILRGDGPDPFFTSIMGAHQRLPNGNILVVETLGGRVLEYTSDGRLAWRYSNRWQETKNLLVFGSKVLPVEVNEQFLKEKQQQCGGS